MRMYQPDTKKYPWLVSKYDSWDEDGNPMVEEYEIIEGLPEGWLLAFGDLMCEDLDDAIRRGHLTSFQFDECKEKYGASRIYSSGGNDETDAIIEDYSHLSENICLVCGKPDIKMTNSGGWLSPICKECWQKKSFHPEYSRAVIAEDPGKMVTKRVIRKNDHGKSQDIEYDLTDKAERIRKAWKERQNESKER